MNLRQLVLDAAQRLADAFLAVIPAVMVLFVLAWFLYFFVRVKLRNV